MLDRGFPKNVMRDTDQGEGSSITSNSRHFMAVWLLKMHQIFMLALAKLRCGKTGGSGARCFTASPFGLPGVRSCGWGERETKP
jgi:hypothetical protein